MVPEVRLNAQEAAARADVSYQHFRRLKAAGQTPPPDGWFGKLPWWRPLTIDRWKRERASTEQTA